MQFAAPDVSVSRAMYHVPEILRVLQREEAHAIDRQLRRLEIRHDEDPAFADVNELEAAEKHFDHGRPGCRLPQHQACAATGLLDGGMHGGAEIPFQREVRQARAHARGHALLRGRLWLTCAGKAQIGILLTRIFGCVPSESPGRSPGA